MTETMPGANPEHENLPKDAIEIMRGLRQRFEEEADLDQDQDQDVQTAHKRTEEGAILWLCLSDEQGGKIGMVKVVSPGGVEDSYEITYDYKKVGEEITFENLVAQHGVSPNEPLTEADVELLHKLVAREP